MKWKTARVYLLTLRELLVLSCLFGLVDIAEEDYCLRIAYQINSVRLVQRYFIILKL